MRQCGNLFGHAAIRLLEISSIRSLGGIADIKQHRGLSRVEEADRVIKLTRNRVDQGRSQSLSVGSVAGCLTEKRSLDGYLRATDEQRALMEAMEYGI